MSPIFWELSLIKIAAGVCPECHLPSIWRPQVWFMSINPAETGDCCQSGMCFEMFSSWKADNHWLGIISLIEKTWHQKAPMLAFCGGRCLATRAITTTLWRLVASPKVAISPLFLEKTLASCAAQFSHRAVLTDQGDVDRLAKERLIGTHDSLFQSQYGNHPNQWWPQ